MKTEPKLQSTGLNLLCGVIVAEIVRFWTIWQFSIK